MKSACSGTVDEAVIGYLKEMNAELSLLIAHIERGDVTGASCLSAQLDIVASRLGVVKKLIKRRG